MTVQAKKSPARSKRSMKVAPLDPSYAEIAEAAYFLAEKRGFVPGYETEDWLKAEQQLHDHGNQ